VIGYVLGILGFEIEQLLKPISMIPKKGDIVELTIDRVAFGGQGIARLDGLVIFVKGAIPGDRVNALIFRKKKAYAEAKIQELLVPSSDRIEAPCPYFGTCGGCQWQHVAYERQIEYKRGHVEEALSHIGSLSGVEVHDAIPSEKKFAYRNKMEFSFSDRPWLPYPPSPLLLKGGQGEGLSAFMCPGRSTRSLTWMPAFSSRSGETRF
jgi:23S rRNA (uracil1939-C5)-methyltransferase